MTWPWTSTTAFHLAVAERDWLREQNAKLTDQLVRLIRKQEGLPEVALDQRKVQKDPMPASLRRLIEGFQTKATRDNYERVCRQRHEQGEPWRDIEVSVVAELYGEANPEAVT